MATPLHDPLAVWFSTLRAHGERPDIHIGRSTDGRTIVWRTFPHEYFDGVGAMIAALRACGYELSSAGEAASSSPPSSSAPERPRPRPGDDSRAARFKHWLRQLTRKIDVALDDAPPWRDFDPDAPTVYVPPAAMSFSTEQTRAIHASARRARVSMTSFLLKTLDLSIGPLLVDPWGPRNWVVPVYLRGRVPEGPRDTANYSSGVYIRTRPGYAAADIHDAVRRELKAGVHLVQWTKQRAVSRLGGHVASRLVRARMKRRQYATAAMSYGGNWTPSYGVAQPPRATDAGQAPPAGDAEQWFAAGTAGHECAILAGTMEWFGRLGVTLCLHSGIADAHARACETVQRWAGELLRDA